MNSAAVRRANDQIGSAIRTLRFMLGRSQEFADLRHDCNQIWLSEICTQSDLRIQNDRAWELVKDCAQRVVQSYFDRVEAATDLLIGNESCPGPDFVRIMALREIIEVAYPIKPLPSIRACVIVLEECRRFST